MSDSLEIKIVKMHENAVIPSYAKNGDAGLDLTCVSIALTGSGSKIVYNTGIGMQIPFGYVGLLFPRSSIHKTCNRLSNCVGVIDSGYRGEISFVFDVLKSKNGVQCKNYNVGDRVGQIIIMPYPAVKFVEVDKLEDSERGVGGFGSTGF